MSVMQVERARQRVCLHLLTASKNDILEASGLSNRDRF